MRIPVAVIAAIVAVFVCKTATANDDPRKFVRLPPDIRAVMLADMRQHINAFDDVLLALSVGDFGSAAVFAEEQMGLGSRWLKPKSTKRSMVEPWGIWVLGREFRAAASRFSVTLTGLGNDRSPEAYAAALKSLREITLRCRGCHATYRIVH
jgi:hypothetical protein